MFEYMRAPSSSAAAAVAAVASDQQYERGQNESKYVLICIN